MNTTGRVLYGALLLFLLLAIAGKSFAGVNDLGYYDRDTAVRSWAGCGSANQTQIRTTTGTGYTTTVNACTLDAVAVDCSARTRSIGGQTVNYVFSLRPPLVYYDDPSDGRTTLEYPQPLCETPDGSFRVNYSGTTFYCSAYSAPVMNPSGPNQYTCMCPGEVGADGKCRPPVNPCDDAPQNFISDPTVPVYQTVNGQLTYMNGNASCIANNCEVPASMCRMDVDLPDLPERGCDYSPTSWTRTVLGVIQPNWSVLYTKTGTDCIGPSPGDGNPPNSDNDGDGVPDSSDPDDDNDGIPDASDPDPEGDGNPAGGGGGGSGGDGGGSGGDGGGGTGGGDGTGGGCDPATEDCGTGGGGDCDPTTEDCGTGGGGDGYGGDGFYAPSYPDGLAGVYNDRKAELAETGLAESVTGFFSADFGGTCPTWAIAALGESYEIDVHCSSDFDWLWIVLSTLVLAGASLTAFRIALE